MKDSEKIAQLEEEVNRLRALVAKIMADQGIPEKNYDEDTVLISDENGGYEYVPFRVAVICNQYNVPWELLYCDEHREWIDEIGSSFPYCVDDMTCHKCRGDHEI